MILEEYKGYYIRPHNNNPKCFLIVTAGRGGKIPDILSGLFTDRGVARVKIDLYLANKEKADGNETGTKK